MAEPNTNGCDNLRVIYNETVAEITRYRDYEWKHAIYFTTAVATIIGLRLTKTINTPCYDLYLEGLVVALTVAHIHFSCYAHKGLAINRSKQAHLKDQMKVVSLDGEIGLQPRSKKTWDNFKTGLWDHLIPFFIVNLLITVFGVFSVLKVSGCGFWIIIALALILPAFEIVYLSWQMKNLDSNQKGQSRILGLAFFWGLIGFSSTLIVWAVTNYKLFSSLEFCQKNFLSIFGIFPIFISLVLAFLSQYRYFEAYKKEAQLTSSISTSNEEWKKMNEVFTKGDKFTTWAFLFFIVGFTIPSILIFIEILSK